MVFPPLRLVLDVPLSESASQHLRNALMLVRVSLNHGEVLTGAEPSIAVLVDVLDAIQRRLEAALALIEHPERVP